MRFEIVPYGLLRSLGVDPFNWKKKWTYLDKPTQVFPVQCFGYNLESNMLWNPTPGPEAWSDDELAGSEDGDKRGYNTYGYPDAEFRAGPNSICFDLKGTLALDGVLIVVDVQDPPGATDFSYSNRVYLGVRWARSDYFRGVQNIEEGFRNTRKSNGVPDYAAFLWDEPVSLRDIVPFNNHKKINDSFGWRWTSARRSAGGFWLRILTRLPGGMVWRAQPQFPSFCGWR